MKRGFTLAEILITLAIIGVVAALTIPSVISNAQQQEFKTGLKKAVSVLNEAIQTNIALEGETPYENSNLFSYFERHMSIVDANAGGSHYYANESKLYSYHSNWHFYTTDGIRFEIPPNYQNGLYENMYLYESGLNLAKNGDFCKGKGINNTFGGYTKTCNCGSYGLASNPNNTITTPCVITVDVNGDRKPNPKDVEFSHFANGDISGGSAPPYVVPAPKDKKITDVFNILITEDRAIPFGVVAQRAMYSK